MGRIRFNTLAAAVLLATALALPAAARAASNGGAEAQALRAPAPQLTRAVCLPVRVACHGHRRVWIGGRLRVSGHHFGSGLRAAFAMHGTRRHVSAPVRRTRHGWVVTVPGRAVSGRIFLYVPHGARSNSYGPIHVIRNQGAAAAPGALGTPSGTAFDGQGMWIWYLAQSEKGDLDAIAARAQAAGIRTVYVKSSDGGTSYWGQFSSALVQALHARGLKVCAWPFVYGTHPEQEADLSIRAVQAGADCLVIDAEGDYEGRYAAAQTYVERLRASVGPDYPLGLAGFPYVDYHPAFPYSVFLGPGGAQFDVPQMYWKDIGTPVDTVYAHTYTENRIYGRTIFPLGQTYGDPKSSDLARFRQLAAAFGAPGLSFFDWQSTAAAGWSALGAPLGAPATPAPAIDWPLLKKGSKGDQVLWLQEHLASADATTPTSGTFDAATDAALRGFQTARGLPATGQTDAATWAAVLGLPVVAVDWTTRPAPRAASTRTRVAAGPASAGLPPVRDEIPPRGGSSR